MGQSNTKETAEASSHSSNLTKISTNDLVSEHTSLKAKKHLTKIEFISLKHAFDNLKSTVNDEYECIEPKKFLEHLNLPSEVEPAGVLLFKSFSYLGSYPTSAGPVPLTFDAFITAFVLLVGRLDTDNLALSEDLFFQSLSVLPQPKEEEEEASKIVEIANKKKELSLDELVIDFENGLDLLENKPEEEDEEEGFKILCRDLTELFVLLLWLGQVDKNTTDDFKEIRKMANDIIINIKPKLTNTNVNDDLPSISHALFCNWKNRFSPHLFKHLQSFIIKSFTYQTDSKRLLPEDQVPEVLDQASDILSPLYTTLLSWSVPEHVLQVKKWTRLYSASQNGFSMNRFENHVFKYPGPTLFIIKVDAKELDRYSKKTIKSVNMILGAYITQPWKHSKKFWGTSECFLFELNPTFDIYRPIINQKTGEIRSDHYIYYHHDFGVGFGALEPHKFILSLENTLQTGTYQHEAYPSQPSFESATKQHLNFLYQFETEQIEVFGLGSEKDRQAQAKEWQFEKNEAAKRLSLNIRQADGELDKELLKMAGIIDEDKRQDR